MIPSLPNNIWNILFTLGVFLLGFTYLQAEKIQRSRNDAQRSIAKITIEFDEKSAVIGESRKNLLETAKELSIKYHIKNPIRQSGVNLVFTKVLNGSANAVLVTNTLDPFWKAYINQTAKYRREGNNAKQALNQIEEALDDSKELNELNTPLQLVGVLMLAFGFIGLMNNQALQEKLLEKQISKDETITLCQSCGKTFNGTVQHAKFKDGEKSLLYCADCFDGSDFTEPDLTWEEAYTRFMFAAANISRIQSSRLKNQFKNYRRWSNGKY